MASYKLPGQMRQSLFPTDQARLAFQEACVTQLTAVLPTLVSAHGQDGQASSPLHNFEDTIRTHLSGFNPKKVALILAQLSHVPAATTITLVDTNDAFLRFFGYQRADVVGQAPGNVYHMAQQEANILNAPDAEQCWLSACHGTQQETLLPLLRKDGSQCLVVCYLLPLPLPGGTTSQPQWILAIHVPVPFYEPSSPAERNLVRGTKARVQDHIDDPDSVDSMLHFIDDEWTIHFVVLGQSLLYVSNSVQFLLGYTPDQLIGAPASLICDENDLVAMLHDLKEIKNQRSPRDFGKAGVGTRMRSPPAKQLKPVRLNDQVTYQPILAQTQGLLRMRSKFGAMVWMEIAVSSVMQQASYGRKQRMVIAISGRPRRMAGKNVQTHQSDGLPLARPTGPPVPSESRPMWLALSMTGVVISWLETETLESIHTTIVQTCIRQGYVLPVLLDAQAMQAAQQWLQSSSSKPMSLLSRICTTQMVLTWIPAAWGQAADILRPLGAHVLVRIDMPSGADKDLVQNKPMDPPPAFLDIPRDLHPVRRPLGPDETLSSTLAPPTIPLHMKTWQHNDVTMPPYSYTPNTTMMPQLAWNTGMPIPLHTPVIPLGKEKECSASMMKPATVMELNGSSSISPSFVLQAPTTVPSHSVPELYSMYDPVLGATPSPMSLPSSTTVSEPSLLGDSMEPGNCASSAPPVSDFSMDQTLTTESIDMFQLPLWSFGSDNPTHPRDECMTMGTHQ